MIFIFHEKKICMYSKLKSIMRYFSCNYYFVLFSKIFLWKWALNHVVWYLKTSEAQELFKSIDIKRSSGIATTIFTLTEFSFDLLLLSNTTTLRIWEHLHVSLACCRLYITLLTIQWAQKSPSKVHVSKNVFCEN